MTPEQMQEMQQQQMDAMRASQGMGAGIAIFYLVFLAFLVACGWKLFTKAGQPGWAAIVPIYNLIVFLKIVGRPAWWIVLMLVPVVSLIVSIILCVDLAKSFGKGTGFAIGLLLLGIVFMPILAFGSATYKGPAAGSAGGAPATATA